MPKGQAPRNGTLLSDIAASQPVRAAGFIVTLYGDAVVPRGGDVWIGTIIEVCAGVGISETLVRTAVSRLVSDGQLEGVRLGRRSYYRLTEGARDEFADAARLIYGPPDPVDWRFVFLPEQGAEARIQQLERQGYARLRPQMAVGPARGVVPDGVFAFDGPARGEQALLPEFAAHLWDLAPHARAYGNIVSRFTPVLTAAEGLTDAEALGLRLLLVHAWRLALLRDPRLPVAALPADWPGHAARDLFARLYLRLSSAAESQISARFQGANGPLLAADDVLRSRLAGLQRSEFTKSEQSVLQADP